MSEDDAFVYVIAKRLDDGWESPCKIGIARNPSKRLASLSTSSPFKIGIYGQIGPIARGAACDLERMFHETQSNGRLNGEWFDKQPNEALGILFLATSFLIYMNTEATNEEASRFAIEHTRRFAA